MAIGMPNRRRFLQTMIATTIIGYTAGFTGIAHALAPARRTADLGGQMRKAFFLGLVGESFVVVSENREKRVRMELSDVESIYETGETEQFSLLFRAPREVKLPPGMYRIRHRHAGKTTMYLQPSGADKFNHYYKAHFNLLP